MMFELALMFLLGVIIGFAGLQKSSLQNLCRRGESR